MLQILQMKNLSLSYNIYICIYIYTINHTICVDFLDINLSNIPRIKNIKSDLVIMIGWDRLIIPGTTNHNV